MKILLFGSNGQVGWELKRALSPLGELTCVTRNDANLEDISSIRNLIRQQQPAVIVNAAAYTAVDKAETEQDLAYAINADVVEVIAQEAKALGALLVHYSTDYVFDGVLPVDRKESDETNPLNVYGLSKLKGEHAIQKSGCKFFIFRTSWVYANRGQNFVKTILRLAQEKDELKIVADQIGTPTSAQLIADVTAEVIQRSKDKLHDHSGIYHLTASGRTTWYDFAKLIVSEAMRHGLQSKLKPGNIFPISTAEYAVPAKRPAYSCLDTNKLSELIDTTLPAWEVNVKSVVKEIVEESVL